MGANAEIASLLEAIPNTAEAAFVLANLLKEQGDARGEMLRLSYELLATTEMTPERVAKETQLQHLLADGYVPLVPSYTNCLGMRFSFIPASKSTPVIQCDECQQLHQTKVSTRAFFMAVTPVTQAQWKRMMDTNPSYFPDDENPVECVSWDACIDFCRRLGELTDERLRLPTAAEWEVACRACTTSDYYSGNSEDALAAVGWYDNNSSDETHPVAQKTPNAWGLYDMHGNVYEWCETLCNCEEQTECRVLRGGAWGRPAEDCRASVVRCYPVDSSNFTIGFRVCFDFREKR